MYDVLIIGGMAAGCKTAARLSRLSSNYNITIIEKRSYVSFSSCGLSLYAGGDINDLSDLNKTAFGLIRNKKYFSETKGINVILNTEVKNIDVQKKNSPVFK